MGIKITLECVRREFSKDGYILLSTHYVRNTQPLDVVCPFGHSIAMQWRHFQQGKRCGKCCGRNKSQEEVESFFRQHGYILLNQYEGSHKKLDFMCPEGHKHSITWTNFQVGKRCGKCYFKGEEGHFQRKLRHFLLLTINKQVKRIKEGKINYSKAAIARHIVEEVGGFLSKTPEGFVVDHIVPQSFFDFSKEVEILACWNLSNLRYLTTSKNSSRGNRLTFEEARRFSKEQFEILKTASRKPKRWEEFIACLTEEQEMPRS